MKAVVIHAARDLRVEDREPMLAVTERTVSIGAIWPDRWTNRRTSRCNAANCRP